MVWFAFFFLGFFVVKALRFGGKYLIFHHSKRFFSVTMFFFLKIVPVLLLSLRSVVFFFPFFFLYDSRFIRFSLLAFFLGGEISIMGQKIQFDFQSVCTFSLHFGTISQNHFLPFSTPPPPKPSQHPPFTPSLIPTLCLFTAFSPPPSPTRSRPPQPAPAPAP